MPYRPEHKEETRTRIIECARCLFNRHGFSEVSIEQVMAEAGLTRGGFYNHFRNKEELFCEAVKFYANCNPIGEVGWRRFRPKCGSQDLRAPDGKCLFVAAAPGRLGLSLSHGCVAIRCGEGWASDA